MLHAVRPQMPQEGTLKGHQPKTLPPLKKGFASPQIPLRHLQERTEAVSFPAMERAATKPATTSSGKPRLLPVTAAPKKKRDTPVLPPMSPEVRRPGKDDEISPETHQRHSHEIATAMSKLLGFTSSSPEQKKPLKEKVVGNLRSRH